MKTPNEIKKGLECCISDTYGCYEKCPYFNSLSNGVDCAVKMHADALAYINQLEARVPEWISVEDRPPEGQVLVANFAPGTEGYKEMDIGYVEVYEMSDAESPCRTVYDKTGFDIWYNITHWMPLPNIPIKKG